MKKNALCRTTTLFILVVFYIYGRYFMLFHCEVKTRRNKILNSQYRLSNVEHCTCNSTKELQLTTTNGKDGRVMSLKNAKNALAAGSIMNNIAISGNFKSNGDGTTSIASKFLEIFQITPGANVKRLVNEMKDREGNASHYSVESVCCKYLINPHHHCKKPIDFEGNFLIFMVKSRYENWNRRQAIRHTWGIETCIKDLKLRTVFVLGQPNQLVHETVAEEISAHDDILQLNIKDVYYNNVLKTIATFHWLSKYCRHTTKYVMMVDDDFYVWPEGLVNMLLTLPKKISKELYMGVVYKKAKPHKVKDKFFLNNTDYPYRYFPPYIPAGSVILSLDIVRDFQLAMHLVKPFKFDDIYIGIIAYFLNVAPQTAGGIFMSKKTVLRQRAFSRAIAIHDFSEEHLLKAWQYKTINATIKIVDNTCN